MRVCIDKKTGKLIEAQSGGDKQEHLNTLINNAILQGYKAGDVEAKFVEDSEFKTLLDEATQEKIEADPIEILIQTKLREIAISALKTEGKLTGAGEIKTKG